MKSPWAGPILPLAYLGKLRPKTLSRPLLKHLSFPIQSPCCLTWGHHSQPMGQLLPKNSFTLVMGESLAFAVYADCPGTVLNTALDSAGIFSRHPGSSGSAGAVWTTCGRVRMFKSPSASPCFLSLHHLRLERLLRLCDEDGPFIPASSALWRQILPALLHKHQPPTLPLLPPTAVSVLLTHT